MPASSYASLKQTRADLIEAQVELDALRQTISQVDALVGRRLGKLLDELSTLEIVVDSLTEEIHHLRDQKLYGEERISYADGAPRPTYTSKREYIPNQDVFQELELGNEVSRTTQLDEKTEMRQIYRRLARLYHPDLATSNAEQSHRTHQMMRINQAYAAGDLPRLRKLWQEQGLGVPSVEFPSPSSSPTQLSELDQLRQRLESLRQQVARLKNHPNIQLSLEIKMARQAGRDLLAEMARDLRRKIERKTAERDYLQSQLRHQV